MSSIDLFLLGFLLEKPWSAYEMAMFVEKHRFHEMLKISTPAVYKNLIKLSEKGFLDAHVVKDSEMPERKIYKITESGKKQFAQLMEDISKQAIRYFFDFSPIIVNFEKIDKKLGFKILNNLENQFSTQKINFEEKLIKYKNFPAAGVSLIKQIKNINDTMIKWINELRDIYKSE